MAHRLIDNTILARDRRQEKSVLIPAEILLRDNPIPSGYHSWLREAKLDFQSNPLMDAISVAISRSTKDEIAFEIVEGKRRFMVAYLCGWTEIPCVIES